MLVDDAQEVNDVKEANDAQEANDAKEANDAQEANAAQNVNDASSNSECSDSNSLQWADAVAELDAEREFWRKRRDLLLLKKEDQLLEQSQCATAALYHLFVYELMNSVEMALFHVHLRNQNGNLL